MMLIMYLILTGTVPLEIVNLIGIEVTKRLICKRKHIETT